MGDAQADPTTHLLRAARRAAGRAQTPDGQRAGAAAETRDGQRFLGAAVGLPELAPLAVCAERVAVWAARAATEAPIERIAIWVEARSRAHPCGTCLQVLRELAPDARLWLQRGDRPAEEIDVESLLPDAFRTYVPAPTPPAEGGAS